MKDSVFRITLIAEYCQHKAEVGGPQSPEFLDMTPRIVAGCCLQYPRPYHILEHLRDELRHLATDARPIIEEALAADKAGKGQPMSAGVLRREPQLMGGGL